jgi:hypothetical protein
MVPAVEQDGERLADVGWVVGDKRLTNGRLTVVVQLDVVRRAPGKVLREVAKIGGKGDWYMMVLRQRRSSMGKLISRG